MTQVPQHSYNMQHTDQVRTERTRVEYFDNNRRIYSPCLINTFLLHLLETIATQSIQRYYLATNVISQTDIQQCLYANCYIC